MDSSFLAPRGRSVGAGPVSLGTALAVVAALLQLEAEARAEDLRADIQATAPPEVEQVSAVERAAASGALSVWTTAARSDTQRGLARLQGGYEGSGHDATFEAMAEASLAARLSLRAGGTYVQSGESLYPFVSARLDVLRQESQGLDLAVSGGYEGYGFNTVAAMKGSIAIGRSIGPVQLLANVGYGSGLEDGESYGDARLAATYRVAEPLHMGVDSRLRIDLERDTDEPPGEPDWELAAAPFATWTIGSFALTGGVGMSVLRRRLEPDTNVGVLATGALSTAF